MTLCEVSSGGAGGGKEATLIKRSQARGERGDWVGGGYRGEGLNSQLQTFEKLKGVLSGTLIDDKVSQLSKITPLSTQIIHSKSVEFDQNLWCVSQTP